MLSKKSIMWAIVLVIVFSFLGSWLFAYAYEPMDMAAEALEIEGSEPQWAPIPDYSLGYTINFIAAELDVSGVFAGLLGSLIVMGVLYLVVRIARGVA